MYPLRFDASCVFSINLIPLTIRFRPSFCRLRRRRGAAKASFAV